MQIIVTKDYDEMSKTAANIIAEQMISKPNSILGLATGSTPVGTYNELVKKYKDGDIDFSDITTVNLDEYRGITRTNDQSYYYFMHDNLLKYVNINKDKVHILNGEIDDADRECNEYEMMIKSLGGIDLQLLGLGHNGHIGFNEPADEFAKLTNCVDLQDSTIEANKRFFDSVNDVPRQA